MGLISNGTTIFDNGAMASGFGGSMVFVSSATASSSASIEFSLGNYKEYKFFFVNIHPSVDAPTGFEFNLSTDNGSNYNVTKTTTWFQSAHDEADTTTVLTYVTGYDLAQSTAFQKLSTDDSADNDHGTVGTLQLFNPASTTYVKHFISTFNETNNADFSKNCFIAGYGNTTSAINAIKFQYTSGNIDAGKILMFGIN